MDTNKQPYGLCCEICDEWFESHNIHALRCANCISKRYTPEGSETEIYSPKWWEEGLHKPTNVWWAQYYERYHAEDEIREAFYTEHGIQQERCMVLSWINHMDYSDSIVRDCPTARDAIVAQALASPVGESKWEVGRFELNIFRQAALYVSGVTDKWGIRPYIVGLDAMRRRVGGLLILSQEAAGKWQPHYEEVKERYDEIVDFLHAVKIPESHWYSP